MKVTEQIVPPTEAAYKLDKAQQEIDDARYVIRRVLQPYVQEEYPDYENDNVWTAWRFVSVHGTEVKIDLITVNDRGPNTTRTVAMNLAESKLIDEDYQKYLDLKARYES